jgi:hypothetical protein
VVWSGRWFGEGGGLEREEVWRGRGYGEGGGMEGGGMEGGGMAINKYTNRQIAKRPEQMPE